MSRLLLRRIGMILLLWCTAISGSIVTGKLMPSVPIAIFMRDTMQADLHIIRIDTRLKTRATERIKLAQSPGWIDTDCRVFLLAPAKEVIQLIYVDLHNRQQRAYLPSPEFNRTSLAGRLPDKNRSWIQYMDAQEVVHSLVMDMTTGATVSVEMPKFKSLQSSRWLWSPDGEHGLLLMQGIDVAYGYLLTTRTGAMTELTVTPRQMAVWSPDGRYLALLSIDQHRLIVLDVATMSLQEQPFEAVAASTMPAWTKDNHLQFLARLDAGDAEFRGYVWSPDRQTLTVTPLHLPASYFVSRAAAGLWSPDSTRLAYSTGTRTIILDTQTGAELLTLETPVSGALWSPDSRYLIEHDRTGKQLVIIDLQTRQITRLSSGLLYLAERWSPDGTELTLFDATTSTLGRLFLNGSVPELRMDFQFPAAENAAFCYPETAA